MAVKIEVVTSVTDVETDTGAECESMESIKVIDHDNSSDRKWLMNHQFWAMRNGRTVTMYPVSR